MDRGLTRKIVGILRHRIPGSIAVLLIVTVATFFLLQAAPGDAVDAYTAQAGGSAQTIEQADIMALVRDLVEQEDMALLFISHDIALASDIADRIAVLRHGRLVEIDDTAAIVSQPQNPYTRKLLDCHLLLDG